MLEDGKTRKYPHTKIEPEPEAKTEAQEPAGLSPAPGLARAP